MQYPTCDVIINRLMYKINHVNSISCNLTATKVERGTAPPMGIAHPHLNRKTYVLAALFNDLWKHYAAKTNLVANVYGNRNGSKLHKLAFSFHIIVKKVNSFRRTQLCELATRKYSIVYQYRRNAFFCRR